MNDVVAQGNCILLGKEVITGSLQRKKERWLYFLRVFFPCSYKERERKAVETKIAFSAPYSLSMNGKSLGNEVTKMSKSCDNFP